MDRESCLDLVRLLTEQVIISACPERLPDFAEEFADFALGAGAWQVSERVAPRPVAGRGLDTILVAGMFFEVLIDAAQLPAGSGERVSFVRQKAKDYLVNHLAGQITLSQFYRLLNLIEEKVGYYFEHLGDDWTGASRPPKTAPPPEPKAIDRDSLCQALARLSLPAGGRRKFTSETLEDFLLDSGGRWFRLLDFEAHFRVNKKTAWSYLNQLLTEGILEHNGEKANRVRYALAQSFRTPDRAPL